MGALHECILCQILFSPRIYMPILPHKLQKDYKMFSMWLQNKDKIETQNALCNFSKSPHMCKLLDYMAWCIMRLVNFALYINGLRSALVGEYSLSGCFMRSWFVWALSA